MTSVQASYQQVQRRMAALVNEIKKGNATEKEYWRMAEFQRRIEQDLFEWAYSEIGAFELFMNCPYAQQRIVLLLIGEYKYEGE